MYLILRSAFYYLKSPAGKLVSLGLQLNPDWESSTGLKFLG